MDTQDTTRTAVHTAVRTDPTGPQDLREAVSHEWIGHPTLLEVDRFFKNVHDVATAVNKPHPRHSPVLCSYCNALTFVPGEME